MPLLPSPRSRPWSLLVVTVILAAVAGFALWPRPGDAASTVTTRAAMVDVVDGPDRHQPGRGEHVQIDTTLYIPAQTPAPAVVVEHGFGGSKDSVAAQAKELAARGFVVLTYSARGFGHSTGQIALNSPDYEVADGMQLLTWLARQPEVLTDGPDDPRVGVTGASYGGAMAIMLAGMDPRVDAIAPVMTYHDLADALLPNNAAPNPPKANSPAATVNSGDGVFKRAWSALLFSAGGGRLDSTGSGAEAPEPGTADSGGRGGFGGGGGGGGSGSSGAQLPSTSAMPGAGGPPSTCGNFRPEICQAYQDLAIKGEASQSTLDLLHNDSPAALADHITAPTFLVQGEQDTLFGLDQADATARQINKAGGTVKVEWFAGGHNGGTPGPDLRHKIGDWFDHYLFKRGPAPGTGFEYAVQGAYRSSGAPSVRDLTAPNYPGLDNGSAPRRSIPLTGPVQPVLNPAGGNPASISSLPGLGAALGAATPAADMPGQAAMFTSQPLDSQLLITGSPQVRLRVAAVPGQQSGSNVTLFAKLYDVGPDGQQTLPGGGVAPLHITGLPADGTPQEVSVVLPGIVHPVESGHRLRLAVTTTDQGYANEVDPGIFSVALAGDAVSVPAVGGASTGGGGFPTGQVLGIAAVLGVAAVIAVLAAVRRQQSGDADPEQADVPLVVDGLTKSYPGGITAARDVSFRVTRGQVLGLLGPNGAGKTTTLRMLMGLVQPTDGEVRVFGHRVTPGAPVLSRIGSFVEGAGFLPHLSGQENLRLFWAATGRPAEQAQFDEALRIAGLGNAVNRKVGTYSQGMRQRLAIAQAMLGLPDLLVLDEPTNGLDPPQIFQMRKVLRDYAAAGRTVLVSSHLLAEVEQTCTHVVVMHRGEVVASGGVAEVIASGAEATFTVDQPEAAATALNSVEGIGTVEVDGDIVHVRLGSLPRSVAVAAMVHAGVAVDQAGPRRRLEDAFLQLVGEGTPT